MAYCIGTYPKLIAHLIRWMINRNPSRTVSCWFRGRSPKRGFRSRQTLPLYEARRVAIYLRWNPHAPVNKMHARAAEKSRIACEKYSAELRERRRIIEATAQIVRENQPAQVTPSGSIIPPMG